MSRRYSNSQYDRYILHKVKPYHYEMRSVEYHGFTIRVFKEGRSVGTGVAAFARVYGTMLSARASNKKEVLRKIKLKIQEEIQ